MNAAVLFRLQPHSIVVHVSFTYLNSNHMTVGRAVTILTRPFACLYPETLA